MNDAMYEQIVAKKTPAYEMPVKIGLTAVLVLLFLILTPFLGMLAIMPSLIIGVLLYYFVFPKFHVEYEYMMLNADLQIDAIYSKEKRKKLMELDMRRIEWIAAANTATYKNARAQKTADYTSTQASDDKVYGILLPTENGATLIRIEPDEKMLAHIRQWTGTKFVRY